MKKCHKKFWPEVFDKVSPFITQSFITLVVYNTSIRLRTFLNGNKSFWYVHVRLTPSCITQLWIFSFSKVFVWINLKMNLTLQACFIKIPQMIARKLIRKKPVILLCSHVVAFKYIIWRSQSGFRNTSGWGSWLEQMEKGHAYIKDTGILFRLLRSLTI